MRYEVTVRLEQSWSLVVDAETALAAQTVAVEVIQTASATASQMHIDVSKGVDGR